jgi:hypothetical protein
MNDLVSYGKPISIEQCVAKAAPKVQKKGNKKMLYDSYDYDGNPNVVTPAALENAKRGYIEERLSCVQAKKRSDLRKKFGLDGDTAPDTVEDVVARLKAGEFTVPSKFYDEEYKANQSSYFDIWNFARNVKWGSNIKADKKGFDEAEKKLDDELKRIRDIIAIGELADAMKAVTEFEKFET